MYWYWAQKHEGVNLTESKSFEELFRAPCISYRATTKKRAALRVHNFSILWVRSMILCQSEAYNRHVPLSNTTYQNVHTFVVPRWQSESCVFGLPNEPRSIFDRNTVHFLVAGGSVICRCNELQSITSLLWGFCCEGLLRNGFHGMSTSPFLGNV